MKKVIQQKNLKKSLKYQVSVIALMVIPLMPVSRVLASENTNVIEKKDYSKVDFVADELIHDKVHNLISARGNVEIHINNNIVRADNITLYQQDDLVKANGNIVILEETGNVLFADYMELKGDLKKGFIDNINIVFSDDSRLAAKKVSRDGVIHTMEYGVYSPCDICLENPEKPPVWQIKAVKVIYDKNNKKVVYKDAWLELGNMPVFYTPYFSHPSPEIKRQSGFLAPKLGGRKNLGSSIEIPYYYDISPQEDLTISPMFTTKEKIVLKGEHRKIYDSNAESEFSGSITNDSKDETKGNLNLYVRKELNDYYVMESKISRASDDTYLKRYGLQGQDDPWLESNAVIEGFDGKSYVRSKAMLFQDLRVSIDNDNTPVVIEPLSFNLINDPDKYGAYTSFQASSMILDRDQGPKSRRISLMTGWHLPYIGTHGEVYELSTTLRGDGYHVENVTTRSGEKYSGFVTRAFPEVSLKWSYPLARKEKASYQVVEPIVIGVISPKNINNSKIPNEDSRDLELDDTNILDTNHFIGHDLVETGARVNYGFKWSVYGEETGKVSGFLGQSYRFSKETYFPEESGLNRHFTDYVGKFKAAPNDYLDLAYSFRLDQASLEARRNEFSMSAGTPAFTVISDYTYINSSEFSDLENRKELGIKLTSELTRYWNMEVYNRHDLTKNGGPINYGASLIYDDECFTVDTGFKHDYTSDRDYEGGFSFGITLFFKPFGKVQTGQ